MGAQPLLCLFLFWAKGKYFNETVAQRKLKKPHLTLGAISRVIHFSWVFMKYTRLKHFRKISHSPDRTRSVICFVKQWQCGRWRALYVLHHWPGALDHMTFFDGSLFSCCEMSWWIQKPTVWHRERERQTASNHPLNVLSHIYCSARSCTPRTTFSCLFSHKAMRMSPQMFRSLRGITGCRAWSCV